MDGLDLATPVTLAEWFDAFYTEAAKGPVRHYGGVGWVVVVVVGGPIDLTLWIHTLIAPPVDSVQQGFREHIVEAVCRQGEVMFVPRGEG